MPFGRPRYLRGYWPVLLLPAGATILVVPWLLTLPVVWWWCSGGVVLFIAALLRKDHRGELFDLSACLPLAVLAEGLPLRFTMVFAPRTIDHILNLGIARAVMFWALLHPTVNAGFSAVYSSLGIAMAACCAVSARPLRTAKALVLAAIIAYPIYIVFPAVGPAHVGDPRAVRNCIPSLHFAWALMLVYLAPWKYRPYFMVYAALIAISTMTTGEHYLIDLIAAVPFAAFVLWVAEAPLLSETSHHPALPLTAGTGCSYSTSSD